MVSIIRPTSTGNNRPQQCRWHTFSSISALEHEVKNIILNSAEHAIKQRGAFHLVLAGGNTPRNVYMLLRNTVTDWQHWHLYFSDERCLPTDHTERNSMMAMQTWLSHIDIPARQIHLIPAELGAEAAASAYAQTLHNIGLFDLVLLGLGEDGHTASLFPQHDWGVTADAPATLAVHHAPKPPADRVTLSAQRLGLTRQLLFLVSGSAKQTAIQAWRNGINIPATSITPACGVDIYLEQSLFDSAKPPN